MVKAVRDWIDHHDDDVTVIGSFVERRITGFLEAVGRIGIRILLLALALLGLWFVYTTHGPTRPDVAVVAPTVEAARRAAPACSDVDDGRESGIRRSPRADQQSPAAAPRATPSPTQAQ